jgi:hypothetical protein
MSGPKIKIRITPEYRRYLWEWGIRTGQLAGAFQDLREHELKKARDRGIPTPPPLTDSADDQRQD